VNSYLWNRNGRFYFRIRIPDELTATFGKREIRKALGTSSKHIALKQAHALFVHVNDKLQAMKERITGFELITLRLLEGSEVTIDTGDADRDVQDAKELLEFVRNSNGKASVHAPKKLLLSQIIAEYCSVKVKEGAWTAKSEQENRAIYALFLKIVGDIDVSALNMKVAENYRNMLLDLPPNVSKYGDKSLEEIVGLGLKPMATTTVNKNLIRVATLFKWAVKFEKAEKNPFDGLTIKKKRKASEERDAFSKEDLHKLFSSPHWHEKKPLKPYYYWLPLIGLFSGMRIEEICQLHLEDIREDNRTGVWCFDINNKDEKKTKTPSSKRLVPIHPYLIELGLLEYVTHLQKKGKIRLFPELKRQRDGYSQSASKWFGRLKKRLGIEPVFHSFRHTVATTLKHKGHEENLVAELLGHSNESRGCSKLCVRCSSHRAICFSSLPSK